MQKLLRLGRIEICFEGPAHWAKKAEASFRLQIAWLSEQDGTIYFPTAHRYVFTLNPRPDVAFGNITTTTTDIRIDKWYKANASLIFQIEAIRQGAILLHGNGFAKSGHAHVFAADGGVGKTSMLIAMQRLGHDDVSFVGDDLIWLTAEGKVLPYIRPMCVYNYHYRTSPEAFRNHPIIFLAPSIIGRAVRLLVRNFLTTLSIKTDFLYTKFAPADGYAVVPVDHVFDKICPLEPIPLNSFNYLRKDSKFSLAASNQEDICLWTKQSLMQEFREYRIILDQFCRHIHGKDFELYAGEIFQRSIINVKNQLVTTTGSWDKPEIDNLLERLSEE